MYFQITIIAVGFAGQQALQLPSGRFPAKTLECRLGFGDHRSFALSLAELDQLECFRDILFDPLIAADRLIERGAFAQQLLCRFGIVPETRILRLSIQLRETAGRGLPVKDASSAAPTTC
jgi:hypothetical protein